ncbi:unnamed protein product [Alopecurus aequalis]
MASTKALFLLAVLLASAVLLAAAASEQPLDKEEKVSTNSAGVQDNWRGGYPGRGGGGVYPGHGGSDGGGGYPGHGGGGGYGPSYCGRWGCCRRGYPGDCIRCCRAANEVSEPMERPEVHN